MSQSPLSEMEKLFDLQEVDGALGRFRALLESSDEGRRAALCAERYEKAIWARKAAASALVKSEQALKRCELDLAAADESVERLRGRIYGGEVTSPKELAALEERLNIERRKKETLEDAVLAAMERLEQTKAQVDKVESIVPKIKREHGAARAAYDRAKAEWTAEIARLEDRRRSIVSGVDPRNLKVYDSLIASTNGRPVAKVINRRCDGCHVELPTGARVGETARCPNCGRLLWWP